MKKDGVSIIICCYNSANRIEQTLKHIFAQEVAADISWELVLVDNNSSDNTTEITKNCHQNLGPNVKLNLVAETEPGLMAARRKGIAVSEFEILLFVDDDNWLEPHYVSTSYSFLKTHPKVGILGGFGEPELNCEAPGWFKDFAYCYATGKQAESETEPVSVTHVYGAGMAIRHSAWNRLAEVNFNSLLTGRKGNALTSGEDNEICLAIRLAGYEIYYDPKLGFKHELPSDRISWDYLRRMFLGFGQAKASLDIYKSVLNGTPEPKDGKLPYWFNRVVYLLRLLKKDIPLLVRSRFSLMEGNEELLFALGRLGHIKGIYQSRKDYLQNILSVYRLRERLDSST